MAEARSIPGLWGPFLGQNEAFPPAGEAREASRGERGAR